MKLLNLIAALGLALALGGCATNSPTLLDARALAAESATLEVFSELTLRYRDTYRREQPYLSPQADPGERELDARRRDAYADFINVQKSVALYLQTLGKLADDGQYDLSAQIKTLGGSIKAWPESGLDQQHASAYTRLGQLITQALMAPQQEAALRAMVRDGDAPVRSLIEAMGALLRYYDKTNANEKKIVLGLFEVELPFADSPRDRLLATLARVHYQDKADEYRQVARRFALAEKNLAALAQRQRDLARQVGPGTASGGASLD